MAASQNAICTMAQPGSQEGAMNTWRRIFQGFLTVLCGVAILAFAGQAAAQESMWTVMGPMETPLYGCLLYTSDAADE